MSLPAKLVAEDGHLPSRPVTLPRARDSIIVIIIPVTCHPTVMLFEVDVDFRVGQAGAADEDRVRCRVGVVYIYWGLFSTRGLMLGLPSTGLSVVVAVLARTNSAIASPLGLVVALSLVSCIGLAVATGMTQRMDFARCARV